MALGDWVLCELPWACSYVPQDIHDLDAGFVSDAVAQCKEAADAVDGAHAALVASGEAQARLLEATVAAQQAAVTRALAAAQDNIAASIR